MKKLALFISLTTYCLIVFSQEIQKYNLFTTSPLISNAIYCIRQFDDGVYVGQEMSLTKFSGDDYSHVLENTNYRYSAVHDVIVIDSSELWFVAPYSIGHKKDSIWTWIDRINNIEIEGFHRIGRDINGRIWLTTYNGLFMYENNLWTHFTESDGVLGGQATALTINGSDVYVAFGLHLVNYGVSKFDGQNWTSFTPENGLPGNSVRDICIDSDSSVWFCTDYGVAKYDGSVWQYYKTENGLSSNIVNCMEIDSSGNYWFGTFSNSETVGGLSKFDGTSWETFSIDDGLTSNKIMQMEYTTENKLWIGGYYSGVSVVNLSTEEFDVERTIKVAGICGFNIFRPYVDKNNTLWILAGGVLSHFANNEWTS